MHAWPTLKFQKTALDTLYTSINFDSEYRSLDLSCIMVNLRKQTAKIVENTYQTLVSSDELISAN